jgi:hypothetical protein
MATKKPALLSVTEIQSAMNNAETGAALTALPTDFSGGSLAPVVEAVQAQEAAAVAPTPEFTLQEKVGALRRSSITNYLSDAVFQAFQDPEFTDFDPTLDHGTSAKQLLREYNIPETEDTLNAMLQGGTAQDQARIANRLAKHQFDMEVLAKHGGLAFTASMVDPATLIVDMATFGTTKALKLGRTATALAGAGANTALLGVADYSGKEVTPLDYAATAALTGGAFAMFGGQAANNIASGKANWFGKLSNPNTKDVSGPVTRFFSEADKVAPTPAAREYTRPLMDDPVRREDYHSNSNASSIRRRLDNITEQQLINYDNVIETTLRDQYGFRNILARKLDLSGNYTAAKNQLNREVAEELLRRNDEFLKFGTVYPAPQTHITKAADIYQEAMNRSGQIAKDSGVRGFENFTPQPGYFHRSWNPTKIRSIGKKDANALITQAIKSGLTGIDDADASVLARAITDRALAKEAGVNTDFLGVLGKGDTEAFRGLLEQGGLSGTALDSAMLRLESKLGEKGTVKSARSRLPLDMTVSYKRADGTRLRMADLIDTDLDRVARNYTATINGRSALAKAGIGADDSEINSWMNGYADSLKDLPENVYQDALQQMRGVMGDFTGNIPKENVLSQGYQRMASLANSTMLAAQGVWQGAEYATMAMRFGLYQTSKEFFKQAPGVKQFLKSVNGKPELVDEMTAVLQLDLARDVRFKPWMQQHDAFLNASNTWVDRLLHAGKQAMPILTAQKFVHGHQTRMASNLALQRFSKALQGDTDALAQIKSYGQDVDWDALFKRNTGNVTRSSNGIATSMNWSQWAQADVDTVMDTVLRYIDDSVMFGRTGQGTGFSRSATGQVLGQFRTFVGYAHNKTMRGTLHNEGKIAFAQLLAYQYPMTLLMVTLNEARKGTLDLESDKAMQELMVKSVSYTAGLGFFADAANTLGLTEGRGGLGVPMLGLTQAPSRIIGGLSKQFDDNTTNDDETLYDVVKGASMLVPVVNGIPGAAMAIESMKGD